MAKKMSFSTRLDRQSGILKPADLRKQTRMVFIKMKKFEIRTKITMDDEMKPFHDL
jgi:hypothetical protein